MKKSVKFILSVACLLAFTQYIAAQSYDIRLNLKKGMKYDQSMLMNMDLAESVSGNDLKVATKVLFVFAQEVKSIDKDGNYTIQSAYARIGLDVDAMGTNVKYDSDKKTGNTTDANSKELENTFQSLIGKKYTLILSPKGKVIKIEGMKAIIDELSKKASPVTAQLLSGAFDEKKMEATYSSSYDYFPEGPVKVGDTWKRKTTIETMFPMDIESAYTLKDVKGNIATIAMIADISVKNDSIDMSGATVKIDLKGNYNGDYHLDLKTGLGTNASLTMPIKGTMEMMGMVVLLTIISQIESGVVVK